MTYEKLKSSTRVKVLLWVFTSIVIALLFPKAEVVDVQSAVGNIWLNEDLIADKSFPILKDDKVYSAEVDSAIKSVFQVFVLIPADSLIKDTVKSLKKALERGSVNHSLFDSDPNLQKYSDSTKALLKRYIDSTKDKTSEIYSSIEIVEGILLKVATSGTLSLDYNQISKDTLAIRKGNFQDHKKKLDFTDLKGARNSITLKIYEAFSDSSLRLAMNEIALDLFVPSLVYSSELTREYTEIARNKVSRNSGIVVLNERIVGKHERITPEIKVKLDSYKSARVEDLNPLEKIRQFAGKFLHIAVLLFLLGAFLFNFRKTLFEDNAKLAIFSVLFLAISFLTFYINTINVGGSPQLLIIIPAVSLLTTIMFDSRVGLYSTLVIALISAGLRGNDYSLVVLNVIAGSFAVYSVRDIKYRQQIYRAMFFIFLGYFVGNVFLSFESLSSWSKLLNDIIYSGINALVCPMLTYTLLRFFERVFKITTDLTLVELSSTDHPLLKEMNHAAPGTFYHSQAVARLAESAAERIGADTLLISVGALYHDIGKIIAPHYFIENQGEIVNPHNELSPETSVKVIREHVLQGIELGKKHSLPKEIIQFIPTHHGTGLIRVFYDKAVHKYGKENVNKDDYRYLGPKPHTREQAILMLADKCESASRSIAVPDPQTLENLINNLINQTLQEKELDEAAVTLSEVEEIKKVFFNTLMTTKHARIRYPEQEKLEKGS
ncbi:HDIG domain-containing protein [Ignavibacteriales bacterium]